MADLDKWLPKWKAAIDQLKIKDQISAEILTPQYDTENKMDFFFMVTVADANALGSGLNQWVEAGAGSSVDAELSKFATCAASLWLGAQGVREVDNRMSLPRSGLRICRNVTSLQ